MSGLLRELRLHAWLLFGFVALIWVVELVDFFLLRGSLDRMGIRPRTLDGLWGILFAPFLHAGPAHLMSNSLPFVVLGWLVLLRGVGAFLAVVAISALLGGLGVWLLGAPNSVHVGASGVIFGLMGYLLFRGYIERSIGSILVALVVGALYGGALMGLLPGQRGVSWEGHLFGFASGAGAARLLRPTRAPTIPRP